MHTHTELPTLRATGTPDLERTQWFDVKFYPYTPPGEDPIFAVVGGCYTVICRCVLKDDSAIEQLRIFKDEEGQDGNDRPPYYNSVEWSRTENGDPLVCVTGPSQIKILDVVKGTLVTTLVGHGKDIHDLAISPQNPKILASCSVDNSIRIWSLDPAHQKQPTAAICYGQGHKDQILTIAYHRKGQYILSGGMDTGINLWRIPDNLEEYMATDKPALVYYPHFSTTELHTDYVDCVRWYNDLIISHAARENVIQLWMIDDFDSERPPPGRDAEPVPTSTAVNGLEKKTVATWSSTGTRSAWGGRFQRLVQFDLSHHDLFYLRFSLFHELGCHPVLIAGNTKSQMFLWDFQDIEGLGAGHKARSNSKGKDNKNDNKKAIPRQFRDTSIASANSGSSSSTKKENAASSKRSRGVGDPFRSAASPQVITVPKYDFVLHQFAWSRDGQWCVGVGTFGVITMLHRWEHGVPPPETRVGRKAGGG